MRLSHLTRAAVAAIVGTALLSCAEHPAAPRALARGGAAAFDAVPATVPLVISQIYGGGGNSGATLTNDFVELFNPGTAAVCYDHLAGETAVRILEGMLRAGWLVREGQDFAVTRLGEKKLTGLGIDLEAARAGRRVFARACVDLTQRRYHLSGTLGAALLDLYIKQGWVQRMQRSRVVSITPKGQEAFRKLY